MADNLRKQKKLDNSQQVYEEAVEVLGDRARIDSDVQSRYSDVQERLVDSERRAFASTSC